PKDNTAVGPEGNGDPANGDDPGGVNYVDVVSDGTAATPEFLISGSVPHIQRLGVEPGPCYTDNRLRPASDFAPVDAPSYTCVHAKLAPGHPLGFAVRALSTDPKTGLLDALSVDGGHLAQMPSGPGGFNATLASLPPQLMQDVTTRMPNPLCGDSVAPPCLPPQLSVQADRGAGQTSEDVRLEAKVEMGPISGFDLLGKLANATPLDQMSQRLDYEQAPSQWGSDGNGAPVRGVRLKVGTYTDQQGNHETAIRAGVNLPLPRYLDFYPIYSWNCSAQDPNVSTGAACADSSVSSDNNQGYDSTDLFIKLVGADNQHDGDNVDYLGRMAVLVQPFDGAGSQMVISGAPDPNNTTEFPMTLTGGQPLDQGQLKPDQANTWIPAPGASSVGP